MKKAFILKGVSALVLVLAVVLAGCAPSSIGVSNSVDDPDVTVKQVAGGVLFSWPAVKDAASYEVWRFSKGEPTAVKVTDQNQDKDGVYYSWDLVGYTNNLKSDTEYTYTIYAIPKNGIDDSGKWEKKVKIDSLLAEGSEPAAPTIDLALNFGDVSSFTITITPPAAGNKPNAYWIELNKGVTNITKWIRQDPDTPLVWTVYENQYTDSWNDEYRAWALLDNPAGEYTLEVTAAINTPYFKENHQWLKKTVSTLFTGSLYANPQIVVSPATATAKSALTGFNGVLSLPVGVPGAVYSIERATTDEQGDILDDYQAITVYTSNAAGAAAATLTPDVLGHIADTVYDKGLPAKKAYYSYRFKAVKDGITDYSYRNLSVDPAGNFNTYFYFTIVKDDSDAATTKYAFTPNLSYTGILQSGDKVVVYSKISAEYSSGYFTEKYEVSSVSFTQAEIDAFTPAPKTLSVPKNPGTRYLYVQAYLEKADGTRQSAQLPSWDTSVIDNDDSRTVDGKLIYAYKFVY